MKTLAIDPGNYQSAYVLMDSYKPVTYGKVDNTDLLHILPELFAGCEEVAIEMIASYGMPVSASIFETCVWIGRYIEAASRHMLNAEFVYRKDVKMNLCHTMKAKDSNVRQALVDRFAVHSKSGKGTKENPDWFYGFAADIWAAYAVGVTFNDKKGEVSQ